MEADDKLRPGDILADKLVHPKTGHTLLPAGAILNESYIRKIVQLGLEEVVLNHLYKRVLTHLDLLDNFPEKPIEVLRNQWLEAIQFVYADDPFDSTPVKEAIAEIIQNLDLYRERDVRLYADYDTAHPLNVMLLSLLTGQAVGLNEKQLLNLGLGALFQDIGLYRLPKNLFDQEGPLSEDVAMMLRKHPETSVELLQNWGLSHYQILSVVRCHHERADGTGYPRGIQKNDIPQMAGISAIADTYDAMLSDRPYRTRLTPTKAYRTVWGAGGRLFDSTLVQAFVSHIRPYPVGCKVLLSQGEVAEVVEGNPNSPLFPLVQTEHRLVNLFEDRSVHIEKRFFPRRFHRMELSGPVTFKKGLVHGTGELVNISGSGLCMLSEAPLTPGSNVILHFNLDGQPLHAKAKVSWTNKEGALTRAGMVFTEIAAYDHFRILLKVNHTEWATVALFLEKEIFKHLNSD